MSRGAAVLFSLLIGGAFLLNLWFLALRLRAWAAAAGRRRALLAALAACAALLVWLAAFSKVTVRGGYDNEHDISYLSMSVFSRMGALSLIHGKEAAPLFADGAVDLLTGYSLPAQLRKNKLLTFASGLLLFAAARLAGFGLPAAALAACLYLFSFLTGLNAATMSTTPANLFFFMSALLAAASLRGGRGGLPGLAWFCAALLLVWTSRYELAPLAGLALLAAVAGPGGGGMIRRPAALLLLGATGLACLAWGRAIGLLDMYNGPLPAQIAQLMDNVAYHLGKRNFSVFLPVGEDAAVWAAAAAAAAALAGAALRDRPRLVGLLALLAGCAYAAVIFSTRDFYQLHFMRHQLYFSLPFILLAAAALEACWRGGGAAAAHRAGWGLLAVFCLAYAFANVGAAARLEPQQRTNDREWGLLLEAARGWPAGCYALFPAWDNRGLLLRKYFPAAPDSLPEGGACFLKYVPPSAAAFSQAGAPPQAYNPFSPVYREGGAPVFERSFIHRFNTVFVGLETREKVPQRAGFYRAETPADRAWLLNDRGMALLRHQKLERAEAALREAVRTDPRCEVCRLNLAAALVFGGRPGEARKELADPRCRPDSGVGLLLVRGLASASVGAGAEAEADFLEVSQASRSGVFPVMAASWLHLLREAKKAK